MKNSTLRRINWVLAEQIGIDLRKLAYAPVGLWKYALHLLEFRKAYQGTIHLMPCIHDWKDSAGSTSTEYFWQDLLVAQLIHQAQPRRHVDVGSRIDGFVAHVAAFRQIEVFDVRPLTSNIPGVVFKQADLMNQDAAMKGVTDSLSCLHALEHFGLGRYGDPINPAGFDLGMKSLAHLLETGGSLYLSCPAGNDVVFYNAHRALAPHTVRQQAELAGLSLKRAWLFDSNAGHLTGPHMPEDVPDRPMGEHISLGIYEFLKC